MYEIGWYKPLCRVDIQSSCVIILHLVSWYIHRPGSEVIKTFCQLKLNLKYLSSQRNCHKMLTDQWKPLYLCQTCEKRIYNLKVRVKGCIEILSVQTQISGFLLVTIATECSLTNENPEIWVKIQKKFYNLDARLHILSFL
jgi:hypothetical protein